MYFNVFYDLNDVEGFILEGYLGKEFKFQANGQNNDGKVRMKGRPIGFRVW